MHCVLPEPTSWPCRDARWRSWSSKAVAHPHYTLELSNPNVFPGFQMITLPLSFLPKSLIHLLEHCLSVRLALRCVLSEEQRVRQGSLTLQGTSGCENPRGPLPLTHLPQPPEGSCSPNAHRWRSHKPQGSSLSSLPLPVQPLQPGASGQMPDRSSGNENREGIHPSPSFRGRRSRTASTRASLKSIRNE